MPALSRVVLFARAVRSVSALELDVFLEDGRHRSAKNDLTGSTLIVHEGGRPTAFVHWIEGAGADVEAAVADLAAYPFVGDCRLLVRAHAASRAYPGWAVSRRFARPDEVEAALTRFAPAGPSVPGAP